MVEVTILANVVNKTHIVKPGPPGEPTNITVEKSIADGWVKRGLAKYRDPDDEVTKEDLLEQSKGTAKRLRESEQATEAARRTTQQNAGKLGKANERIKLLGIGLGKASQELVAAGKRIEELEAEAKEGGAELQALTAQVKSLEADLDKATAPAEKAEAPEPPAEKEKVETEPKK